MDMNQVKYFIFRAFLLTVCLFYSSIVGAYDFGVGKIFYNIISSDQVEVTYNVYRHPDGSYSGTVQIPETVNYNNVEYHVTSIGNEAFTYSSIKNLTIPNSVITVGESAFLKCELESITLSTILENIGKSAFSGCDNLKSITIPNSVTSIGDRAFEDCRSLESVSLPNNLETIPDYLFWGSNLYLTSINIPSSVKTIGKHAFDNCAFTSITIPEGVLTIGEGAFQRCNKLKSISIPSTVTTIEDYAFASSGWSIELVESNIQSPFSIPDNVFKEIKTTAVLQVPHGTKSQYQKLSSWTKFFSDIIETKANYTLSLTAIGNGSATYDGTTVKEKTSTFTVIEGTDATITFSPNNGYQIKSVKVNNTDVTSSVSNNSYTISNISGDTTVEVEFEAIPPTTYTLSIKATGNGSATYDGTAVKGKTSTFTVVEGTNVSITFSPDNGYRIKSVNVNNADVTSSISNNSYTISNISSDTTVEVEFEAIPPTTYTLSIKATGNGSASYDGTVIRGKTSSFTVIEGTSATISFSPDDGYRIKNVTVNNADVTSSVSNNSYTISNISSDTNVEVEFEVIPPTTYTLSITATGNGSASYDGTIIRGKTSSFTVTEGTSVTISFTPDDDYRIKSVTINGADVTSSVSNNSYTVSNISSDTAVEVEFEAIPPTTYTLSITATGNGTVTYDDTDVRGKTSSFTVIKGTSATITFEPDDGYRIKSVMVNNSDVTSRVSNDSYTISSINGETTVEVEFEAIPPTTYTLSIKATGNGSATYDGTAVRDKTSTFTVIERSSADISFSPDDGYRIKSVKVNSTDVTSSVSNNTYTISSVSGDTTVEVEFEAIPPTTYTLSIKATGNGSASYDGTTIREKTSTFTVIEGTNATISFSSDNGYRIKSVKVNNSDVTSSVANGSYTVSSISRNTTVEVEFEAIPTTTYTLSIKATGNGSASYEGTPIKNSTNTFTVNEGANATITFTPDNGYRIKNVKVNSTDVTSSVSNNTYTLSNISGNTAVEVEFEAIPATAFTLSVKASGNGTVTYDGTVIRGKTSTFNVTGGASATISFSPDNGNRIKSVKVNSADVTSKVMNNSYTVSNISGNTTVEVEFEEIVAELTNEDVYYNVISESQQTVSVAGGAFGMTLEVPASFSAKNKEWKVVGVEADVLNNSELAAIIWNPEVAFSGKVNNPNLLLYVKDKKYAPDDIKNVVVNGEAEDIELTDAENGNNFYCPQTFTAKRISYVHRYSMKTGYKTCQGWESIVLPFDVTTILSATGTEIVPYSAWQQGSNSRPFWLYSMNSNGWKSESSIKANTPYIISMPNNEEYEASYNLSGDIQFTSSNVLVIASDGLSASKCSNKQLVPNYQNKVASQDIYALNVNSLLNTNTDTAAEGSAFIRSLRQVRPFEAYMTIEGNAGARRVIPIFEDETTGVPSIPVSIDWRGDAIYNLNGQRVSSMSRGIYIQNGKKIIKK